jgi:hypothetical protein
MVPIIVRLGDNDQSAQVCVEITGYEHPDVVEPHGMDLLACRVHAIAPPVDAIFDLSIRVEEFLALRAYLEEINSGNGPPATFGIAGGLFTLAFAPSRRGPVLCAVQLKSIEASHVRLEYMVTLEPESITRSLQELALLESAAAE